MHAVLHFSSIASNSVTTPNCHVHMTGIAIHVHVDVFLALHGVGSRWGGGGGGGGGWKEGTGSPKFWGTGGYHWHFNHYGYNTNWLTLYQLLLPLQIFCYAHA